MDSKTVTVASGKMPLQPQAFLVGFFQALDASGIIWCVVGDASNLPEIPDNDIDIVVAENQLPQALSLLVEFCSLSGWLLVQCLQHESNAYYNVVCLPTKGGGLIKLDLCGDYLRNARPFLLSAWLLEGRRRMAGSGVKATIWTAAPRKEFAYYLFKKIDKGRSTASGLKHLYHLWQEDYLGASEVLMEYWAATESQSLVEMIARTDIEGFAATARAMAPKLRQELGVPRPKRGLAELRRRFRRMAHASGLFVVVLGPDGSGKSTIIEGMRRSYDEAFRQTVQYHLRPYVLSSPGHSADAVSITDPHGTKPYSPALCVAKVSYIVLDYIFGYWLKIRPALVRSTFVIFDRYYQDLLVDPLRFRLHRVGWLVKLFEPFVPRPDVLIILNASAAIIQGRKQEVSFAETERQLAAYVSLERGNSSVHIVDASQPVVDVVATVGAIIGSYLARRFEQRGGHALPHVGLGR